MKISTTARTTTKGNVVTAKAEGKQVTVPVTGNPGDAHGEAAAQVALKVQPTGWTVEQVNSATKTKTANGYLITIG